MPSQNKLDQYYMSLALRVAELSHGVRAKVGSCLVTESDITVLGTNGLPKALGNELEFKEFGCNGITTKKEVIHAELKAQRTGAIIIDLSCVRHPFCCRYFKVGEFSLDGYMHPGCNRDAEMRSGILRADV